MTSFDRAVRPAAIAATLAAVLLFGLAWRATAAPAGTVALRTSKARATSVRAAADTVYLRAIVRYLADPAREGRGAGTAGLDSSAVFIEREMRRLGLRPGGDGGGFRQPFEVTTGAEAVAPCRFEAGGRGFALGQAFQPLGFSTNGTLRAPVVFAGYGITAPGYEYDDYAGVDARDRLVLVMIGEPGEMDSTSRFDGSVNTPHAELRTKAINAREHGALGLLVVNGPRHHAGEPLRPPRTESAGYMTSGLLAARVSEEAAAALLAPAGLTLAALQDSIDTAMKPRSIALAESATVTVTLRRQRARIANVVGWLEGRDTLRTLVLGAHYDHLGYGAENSFTPDARVPHVGADDNASGVAALLGAARVLAARRASGWTPAHRLVFCAFAGEEMGVVGSGHYVEHPTFPLPTLEAMINMDMVGRLRDRRLMVLGTGTAAEFPALVANANRAAGFEIKTSEDGYGPSDQMSFYKKKVPVLMLFTGAHADYHRPSDTWDKLSYPGLAQVSRFAAALVESLAARPRPTYTQAKGDSLAAGRIGGGGGYGAWLGTIPDFMQTEGGVRLQGVRENSPAAQAGLKEGDTIVRFDGVNVDNLYDYTYALRSRKPGQQVRITITRDGAETEILATLGRRP